jgi:hypothetical protein
MLAKLVYGLRDRTGKRKENKNQVMRANGDWHPEKRRARDREWA